MGAIKGFGMSVAFVALALLIGNTFVGNSAVLKYKNEVYNFTLYNAELSRVSFQEIAQLYNVINVFLILGGKRYLEDSIAKLSNIFSDKNHAFVFTTYSLVPNLNLPALEVNRLNKGIYFLHGHDINNILAWYDINSVDNRNSIFKRYKSNNAIMLYSFNCNISKNMVTNYHDGIESCLLRYQKKFIDARKAYQQLLEVES